MHDRWFHSSGSRPVVVCRVGGSVQAGCWASCRHHPRSRRPAGKV